MTDDLYAHGYEKWESRFATMPPDSWAFGADPTREVQLAVQLYRQHYGSGKALAVDLGAGDGRNTLYLAQQGFEVIAVEGAPSGVERLKGHLAARGLSAQVELADLRDYNLPANIDLLIASFVIHMLPTPYKVLQEWQTTTRGGGLAMVSSRGFLPHDPAHYWFPEMMELKHLFMGANWRILHAREEDNLHSDYGMIRHKIVLAQKPL